MADLCSLGVAMLFLDHRSVNRPCRHHVVVFEVQHVFWETESRLPRLARGEMLKVAEQDGGFKAFALLTSVSVILQLCSNAVRPFGGLVYVLLINAFEESLNQAARLFRLLVGRPLRTFTDRSRRHGQDLCKSVGWRLS